MTHPDGLPAPPPAPLDGRFREHLRGTGLLAGAGHVVVACSGGGDSTALLLLLDLATRPGGPVLVAAHVAHGLRGAEGARDARTAADQAAALGLPFALRLVDVRALREKGESLEAAGRRLRYESLLALAVELGPGTLVATGHTLDDQAETVLLHLSRKAGRSRGGIRERRPDGVVRPLLPFRREELRAFLSERGVAWREDASNADERFARNRIRHSVLPALEAASPGAAVRLSRAGAAWSARLSASDRAIDEALAARSRPPDGPYPRDLVVSLGRERAGRLLVRAVAGHGRSPGRAQVERVLDRLWSARERFDEALGGSRLSADRRTVRLVSPGRLDR